MVVQDGQPAQWERTVTVRELGRREVIDVLMQQPRPRAVRTENGTND